MPPRAPFVATVQCGDGLRCAVGAGGATCVPSAGCRPGDTECRGDTLASCEGGSWTLTACGFGCQETPLGAGCPATNRTVRYANHVSYELRTVNETFTDWSSSTIEVPARRFLVLSFADGELLDAAVTDDDGAFELDAVPPDNEDGDDGVALFAARVDGDRLSYAVLDPGLSQGETDVRAAMSGGLPNASLWFWSWTSGQIPAGDGVILPLGSGSGAAHAYDYLSAIHDYSDRFFGAGEGASLVMWLGMGTSWSCGACFVAAPGIGGGVAFDSQIFYPGDADEAYWSGAVLAHELGHWVMSTYGVSPGEGGTHLMGIPSHPGLAWSEGFATWFSAVARGESYYYDKQDGVFFWVDHGPRAYSSGQPWYRPEASLGLEQLIDENEVTRMLLGLTSNETFPGMFRALTSPRMTLAPFLRGYFRRTWDGLDGSGLPLPAWSTDESAPHLADYLDALVCGGVVDRASVDAQTEPWAHYPYPSLSPLCRRAELPIEVRWLDDASSPRVEVRWHMRLESDLVLRFVPTSSPATIVPAGTEPGAMVLEPVVSGASPDMIGRADHPPEALEVHISGEGWGAHGRVPRTPPRPVLAVRDGPHVVIGKRKLGPSLRAARKGAGLPRNPVLITAPGLR